MTAVIECDTPRLRLRQWREADRAPFAQLTADPDVMAFFPSVLTRAQSDAMADACQALIAEHGWGFWAVETRAERQFIGFVGLHAPAAELPCSPCVEIGWRLARAHWGLGYASEAARAALRVGFEALALPEIVAFTAVPNLRSQAVMVRLGMQPDGRFDHPALLPGHALREHRLYRLPRDAWRRTVAAVAPQGQ